jgi:hypothetical protein
MNTIVRMMPIVYFDKIRSIRVNFDDVRSKIFIENKNFRSKNCSRYNFECLKITRTGVLPFILNQNAQNGLK